MGEGILGHVSKGVVLTNVDAAINQKNDNGEFHLRPQFLDELKRSNTPAYAFSISSNRISRRGLANIGRVNWPP